MPNWFDKPPRGGLEQALPTSLPDFSPPRPPQPPNVGSRELPPEWVGIEPKELPDWATKEHLPKYKPFGAFDPEAGVSTEGNQVTNRPMPMWKRAADFAGGVYNNTAQPASSVEGLGEEVIGNAMFPFIKMGKATRWVDDISRSQKNAAQEAIDSVKRDPEAAELLSQVDLQVAGQTSPGRSDYGMFEYGPGNDPNVEELPDFWRQLQAATEGKQGTQLEAPWVSLATNPTGKDETAEEIARTLRHELRHFDQFGKQTENLRDSKTVLPSHMLSDYGGRFSVPSLNIDQQARYQLAPHEVDARAFEVADKFPRDIPQNRYAMKKMVHPDYWGRRPESALPNSPSTAIGMKYTESQNPNLNPIVQRLRSLSVDDKRLTPDLEPGWMGQMDVGNPNYARRLADANDAQAFDIKTAVSELARMLGLVK